MGFLVSGVAAIVVAFLANGAVGPRKLVSLQHAAPPVQSLRERARNSPDGVGLGELFLNIQESSVEELSERAHVIVYGRIDQIRSHLVADESEVDTDYSIAPFKVYKETIPVVTSGRPGRTVALNVTRSGGQVIDHGTRLVTLVNMYPEKEPLSVGQEIFCFLTYRSETNSFSFTDGPYGAFPVNGGVVSALTTDAAQRRNYKTLSVADFQAVIERALPAKY
jgi:hypothetical protein